MGIGQHQAIGLDDETRAVPSTTRSPACGDRPINVREESMRTTAGPVLSTTVEMKFSSVLAITGVDGVCATGCGVCNALVGKNWVPTSSPPRAPSDSSEKDFNDDLGR